MLPLLIAAATAWLLLRRRRSPEAKSRRGAVIQNDGITVAEYARPAGISTLLAGASVEHPHATAIERLSHQPPPLQLPPPPAPNPPPLLGSGKLEYAWVNTVPLLAAAAMELYEQDRIALDVEHHSQHSYAGLTCLLQLSTGTKDFLIDCLALPRDDLRRLLAPVLSNPRICLVVHGAGNDVAWLQRDFGLYLVNIFDTEKACQVLGFQQRSLGLLLKRFCGVNSEKSLGQLADWRQRPLPPELVEYARRDVHHLLYIADCLGQLLVQEGGTTGHGQPAAASVGGQETAVRAPSAGAADRDALGDAGVSSQPVEPVQLLPAPAEAAALAEAEAAAEAEEHEGEASAAREQQQAPEARQVASTEPQEDTMPPQLLPSVVELLPEAREALAAAMAAPHSHLFRAVHRSQAVTLSLYQPMPPAAAVAGAAAGLMRRHMTAELDKHARLTAQQVQHMETLADCVHALAGWRDAAARAADEGLQCLLPDAVLLSLAEAAAASVAPDASNLRGRHQGLSEQQLLALIPESAAEPASASAAGEEEAPDAPTDRDTGGSCTSAGSCSCYPAVLRQQAGKVAALLSEAAAGQRPWVSSELQDMLQQAAGGGGSLSGNGSGSSNKAHKRRDPAAFRQRLAEKFSCKGTVYENSRMYSQDGELLCHTDKRKLLWYIKKGLAEKISDEPLCVRLTFQHKTGDQQQGTSEFYTVEKQNRCVACGEEGHYLRYRVVPSCYRRAMPVSLKSHRSHDVVLLCVSCHEVAQTSSEQLKRTLAKEHGIPLLPPLPKHAKQQQQRAQRQPQAEAAVAAAEAAASKLDMHPFNVRRSALALQRYSEQMPEVKRRQLEDQIRRFLAAAGTSSDAVAEIGPSSSSSLTPLELCHGLLAGLGPKTRRRTLKRWVRQGRELPPELTAEVAAAGATLEGEAAVVSGDVDEGEEGDAAAEEAQEDEEAASAANSAAGAAAMGGHAGQAAEMGLGDLRNVGHAWHGQQVVERILAEAGEDGLLDLCRRFRQCFVNTLQPQFLPAGWAVYHFAKREFGTHSIYSESATPAHSSI